MGGATDEAEVDTGQERVFTLCIDETKEREKGENDRLRCAPVHW